MKAITIWQPWAELIIRGHKTLETRSWATSYTGIIAIHAGKYRKLPHEIYEQIAEAIGIAPEKYDTSWLHTLEQGIPVRRFGAVLGTAIMGEALPTTLKIASHKEKALGDFAHGRYAWPLQGVRPLDFPIQATGKQGIWNWVPPDCAGCLWERLGREEMCYRCSRYIRLADQYKTDHRPPTAEPPSGASDKTQERNEQQ